MWQGLEGGLPPPRRSGGGKRGMVPFHFPPHSTAGLRLCATISMRTATCPFHEMKSHPYGFLMLLVAALFSLSFARSPKPPLYEDDDSPGASGTRVDKDLYNYGFVDDEVDPSDASDYTEVPKFSFPSPSPVVIRTATTTATPVFVSTPSSARRSVKALVFMTSIFFSYVFMVYFTPWMCMSLRKIKNR